MIDVVRLWETLAQSAKTGTSGYQTADEFNRDLASVQTGLAGLLAPLYAANQTVQDLLAPFVVPLSQATSATGVLAKPNDYFQMADATIDGWPATQVNVNERAMLRFIPSRKPSKTDNIYVYFLESDSIKFLPESQLSASITYIRQPEEASIILQEGSTEDSDYVTPISGANLEWPERAFNLILYMMMQKLGLSMKETLILEFGNMGIQMEQSKL